MPTDSAPDITIYSDGGAIGNPGPGGFGVVVEANGKSEKFPRGYRRTTNNRMELLGVIAGLESTVQISKGRNTLVVTDSRYVIDGVTKGWAKRWRANGWRRNNRGEMALNPDLWALLLDAIDGRSVQFEWVKGHAGHPQNEQCDAMVRQASNWPSSKQLVDHGYVRKGAKTNAPVLELRDTAENDAPERKDETSEPTLTHIDSSGKARMVDVGDKPITERVATASCEVAMSENTLALVEAGNVQKGDVIATAKLAGVMAAKRTAELIPLCHNIPISQIDVDIEPNSDRSGLDIVATARADWRTGVEMEAMTAASVAALTVYDMCKSAERGIKIHNLRLIHKSGGKSGVYNQQ